MASSTAGTGWGRGATKVIVTAGAAYTLAFGVWMWGWPQSFSEFAGYPNHEHFLHDLGAYHMGVAAALLAALWVRDAVLVALVGLGVASAVHTLNHAIDLDLGGAARDPYVIGAMTLVVVAGIVLRARRLRARGRGGGAR
ncbi:hypothetical protein [Nonomuraea lactucae]|uniref:hypothetical protein n=1 Tax=Nonomuraea lactucae TaxID=2249762 RepID=UPI0013B42773|nr:hypothetical protein [Nonomuraea lactucae]